MWLSPNCLQLISSPWMPFVFCVRCIIPFSEAIFAFGKEEDAFQEADRWRDYGIYGTVIKRGSWILPASRWTTMEIWSCVLHLLPCLCDPGFCGKNVSSSTNTSTLQPMCQEFIFLSSVPCNYFFSSWDHFCEEGNIISILFGNIHLLWLANCDGQLGLNNPIKEKTATRQHMQVQRPKFTLL